MSDKKNKVNNGSLDKAFFKEWLEKLQQESWQLELIISGFALYGIYNSKGLLIDLADLSHESTKNIFLGPLRTLLQVGWKIFFINLLLHVILRSLWIGAIGLRYVSADIDYTQLNYSEYFTNYLKRKVGDYDDFIERLEKVCSVLFSYTFLLFLLFMSILCYFMSYAIQNIIFEWIGFETNVDGSPSLWIIFWFLAYFFISLIVFVDFITLGGLKRIKDNTLSKIYMPIYRFFSTITLSFLYRPLLYNFIDDKYTRRLFFFSLPYIFLIAFGQNLFTDNNIPHIPKGSAILENGTSINSLWYDDLYEERFKFIDDSEIKETKENVLFKLSAFRMKNEYESIFLKHLNNYKGILEKKKNISPIYKAGWHFSLFDSNQMEIDDAKEAISKKRDVYDLNKRDTIMNVLLSLVDISIDSVNINDKMSCFYATHPNNGEKGIRCFFKTTDLDKGMHNLYLDRIYYYNSKVDSLYTQNVVLPFIKE